MKLHDAPQHPTPAIHLVLFLVIKHIALENSLEQNPKREPCKGVKVLLPRVARKPKAEACLLSSDPSLYIDAHYGTLIYVIYSTLQKSCILHVMSLYV